MAEPQTLPFHSSAPKPDATIMRTRGRIDVWRGEGGGSPSAVLPRVPGTVPERPPASVGGCVPVGGGEGDHTLCR